LQLHSMHATTPTLVTCASAAHVVKSRQTVLLSVALLSLRLQRSDLIFLGPVNRASSRSRLKIAGSTWSDNAMLLGVYSRPAIVASTIAVLKLLVFKMSVKTRKWYTLRPALCSLRVNRVMSPIICKHAYYVCAQLSIP
jgi:hypothetical protein